MRKVTKKKLKAKTWFKIAVGYTFLITVLFLLPSSDLPKISIWDSIPYFDKLIHLSFHSIMAFIWLQYLSKKLSISNKQMLIYLLIGCLMYGIIIELLQYIQNDGRKADVWDVLANFTGSVIGVCLFLFLKKQLKT